MSYGDPVPDDMLPGTFGTPVPDDMLPDVFGKKQKKTEPIKIGMDALVDTMTQEIESKPWLERNLMAMTAGPVKAWEAIKQLAGQEDQGNIVAANAMERAAPVGGIAGNIGVIAPAMMIPGANTIVGQGLIGAIQGGLLTPGTLQERLRNSAADAALNAGGQGIVNAGVWGANKIGSMGSLDRARRFLDSVIGGDRAQAEQLANAARGTDLTTSQALEPLNNPTLAALGSAVEDINPTVNSKYYRLAQEQAGNLRGMVTDLAGAGDQTGARALQQDMKKDLNAFTTPMRDEAIAQANMGAKYGIPLQNEADRLAEAAASKVEDVRHFNDLQNTAEKWSQNFNGVNQLSEQGRLGMPRLSGRYSYANELADRAAQLGVDAADESLILGTGARFAQARADSLAAHGLKPIDESTVVAAIRRRMSDPELAGSDVALSALGRVAEDIAIWKQKGGGVIDAAALDAIRKNSVNSVIMEKMGAAKQSAQNKAAARVMTDISKPIAEAIVDAGGEGYRDYLKLYAQGSGDIAKQQLFAKVLNLMDNGSPKSVQKLLRGDDPKTVEKIFGPGKYNLAEQLSPGEMSRLMEVSSTIGRERNIDSLSKAGQASFGKVMQNFSASAAIPSFISPKVTVMNAAIRGGEARVNEAMMQALEKAMSNPQEFNALLNMLPVAQRNPILRALNAKAGVYGVPGAMNQ